MTATTDLGPAARQVARVLEATGDKQLSAPTPCPQYRVRHLVGHLAGLSLAFRDAARKEFGPATDTDPGTAGMPEPEPGWRTSLPERLDRLAAAWRDPAAWEGMTRAGGVDLPGAVAGLVALNELVVHGWDLARSIGREYDCDSASLTAVHGFLEGFEDSARGDAFAPAVPVPAGASLLDRVIALSGRDPSWTAAGASR